MIANDSINNPKDLFEFLHHDKVNRPANWDVTHNRKHINCDTVVDEYWVTVQDEDDTWNFVSVRLDMRSRMCVCINGHTYVCDNAKHNFYRKFTTAYPNHGYTMKEDNNYSTAGEFADLESDIESIIGWRYYNGLWLPKS